MNKICSSIEDFSKDIINAIKDLGEKVENIGEKVVTEVENIGEKVGSLFRGCTILSIFLIKTLNDKKDLFKNTLKNILEKELTNLLNNDILFYLPNPSNIEEIILKALKID